MILASGGGGGGVRVGIMQCSAVFLEVVKMLRVIQVSYLVLLKGKGQISDVSTSDSEGVASRMSLEPVKQVM